MEATLITPRGSKIRTRTNSRFVLIGESVRIATGTAEAAWIEKRSAKVETLRDHISRVQRFTQGEAKTLFTIMDTVTGSTVSAQLLR